MRVAIAGAGSSLAEHLIRHHLDAGHLVSGLYYRPAADRAQKWVTRGMTAVAHQDDFPSDVDALVTLTGLTMDARIERMTDFAWREVIDASLTAPFKVLKAALPKMRKGGSVVVVGSVVGGTGGYGCANYAAAKAGLLGLVRAAANENPDLRINLLELGFVNCGMGARLPEKVKTSVLNTVPMKRFAEPSEVVDAINFLLTQTYMTGDVLTFAGGLH